MLVSSTALGKQQRQGNFGGLRDSPSEGAVGSMREVALARGQAYDEQYWVYDSHKANSMVQAGMATSQVAGRA